jgi:L-lactate dehydrogenase complex protein LldG
MKPPLTARDAILGAVRSAKPASIPHPSISAASRTQRLAVEVVDRFIAAAGVGSATVFEGRRRDLSRLVNAAANGATRMVSALPSVPSTVAATADVRAMSSVELVVCEATLGVAENGAVWLPLSRLGSRAAFFLAEHTVVVLSRSALVWDMHDAYARIDVSSEVFGAFVAGPSKTADIEQSLVIGAHGPKALTILLLTEEQSLDHDAAEHAIPAPQRSIQ